MMRVKRKIGSRIFAMLLFVTFIVSTFGTIPQVEAATVPAITYRAHSQDKGWMTTVKNGATAGTTGQAKRLEALIINLKNGKQSAVTYRAHVANVGWQAWKTSGATAGTTGQGRQIEAVQIKLTGTYANKYDIYYRLHVANIGWLGWAKNGAVAGSTGSSIRAEAIQIKLVSKGTKVSGSGIANISKNTLSYQAHSQDKGWMSTVSEGRTAGTTAQSKRLEALKINLKDYSGNNGIQYSAHVSNVGWQSWKTSGQIAGTTGRSLQIEAVKIKLAGSNATYYDVYYRLHVAGYGWLGWAKNGAIAGTTGGGIRAEAIEIKLVAKGQSISTGGAAYLDGSNISQGIHLNHHMTGSLDQNSYRLYNAYGNNIGCCATAYAIGLSIITGANYNPESFWGNGGANFTMGHVNNWTTFNANTIYNNLLQGKPSLVHVYYYKNEYTTGEHWVLVIGVRAGAQANNLQYSDFTIIDPWGGAEKNLTSIGYWSGRYCIEMRTMY